jgi:hypothetical protein
VAVASHSEKPSRPEIASPALLEIPVADFGLAVESEDVDGVSGIPITAVSGGPGGGEASHLVAGPSSASSGGRSARTPSYGGIHRLVLR